MGGEGREGGDGGGVQRASTRTAQNFQITNACFSSEDKCTIQVGKTRRNKMEFNQSSAVCPLLEEHLINCSVVRCTCAQEKKNNPTAMTTPFSQDHAAPPPSPEPHFSQFTPPRAAFVSC